MKDEKTISLNLNITSISDNLLVESFKYVIVRDAEGGTNYDYDNPILSGDFTKMKIGDNLLSSSVPISSSSTSSFEFIVYIDGNDYNDPNMQENSLVGSLNIGDCSQQEDNPPINPPDNPPKSDYQLLSTKSKGSYVKYTGNNGCSDKSCEGQNANYESDSNMGYCFRTSNKYKVNGWRIAYIQEDTVYLTSAGGLECVATDDTGAISYTRPSNYETTFGIPKHIANLNSLALKYCNTDYAYGNKCDSSSAWALGALDFEKITGNPLNSSDCFHKAFNTSCGYNNDMIDIGSYFWINTHKDDSDSFMFYWESNLFRTINESYTNEVYGIRPVLRLKSSVGVVSGSGTYADPYVIINN